MKTSTIQNDHLLLEATRSMLEWRTEQTEEKLQEIAEKRTALYIGIVNSESGIATKEQETELERLAWQETKTHAEREELLAQLAYFNSEIDASANTLATNNKDEIEETRQRTEQDTDREPER